MSEPNRGFYEKLINSSGDFPVTTQEVLNEKIELIRYKLLIKVKVKKSLIKVYAVGTLMLILCAVNGSCLAMPLALPLALMVAQIVRDIGTTIEFNEPIDKLKGDDVGPFNPGTTGPFWF